MSQDTPRFTKRNEEFACHHCGAQVPLAGSTCRDHCPFCLWSLHVDVNPGDRQSDCGGPLKPVGYTYNRKKGYMIEYTCERCGAQRRNRFLESDPVAADNYDALLALTPKA